jgi:hypothetical protein
MRFPSSVTNTFRFFPRRTETSRRPVHKACQRASRDSFTIHAVSSRSTASASPTWRARSDISEPPPEKLRSLRGGAVGRRASTCISSSGGSRPATRLSTRTRCVPYPDSIGPSAAERQAVEPRRERGEDGPRRLVGTRRRSDAEAACRRRCDRDRPRRPAPSTRNCRNRSRSVTDAREWPTQKACQPATSAIAV